MKLLGFDIGGTFIKYAIFDENGDQLIETVRVTTPISMEKKMNGILESLVQITESILEKQSISGIAVSTAGVVNVEDGSIAYSGYTIPNYAGTPIKRRLEEQFNRPCEVINDVNAAALGEYWKGFKEKKPSSMICITFGTGIGGAVIIDGKLYEGFTGRAGEIGYLPISGSFFQDKASATALLKTINLVTGEELTGEMFFKRYRTEQISQKLKIVFENFINDLARGILVTAYLLNPQVIVLGGGIMANDDIILPLLTKALKEQVVDSSFCSFELRAASQGNNAGMLGAIYNLLKKRF